jgi:lysophospholipase L1-like esterase
MPVRFRWLALLAVLALVAIGCKAGTTTSRAGSGPPPVPVPGFPSSMVALGDSITAGFGACFAPTACPRSSWATGDGTQVLSHYRRILDANPAIGGHNLNLAQPGARVAALPGQAATAARHPVDYVTILAGANDACIESANQLGSMTPPSQFRASVDEALATIKRAMPKARLLMVSLPDVYRVWEIGHTNKLALADWKAGVCPNLLTNATSTAPADVARRAAFAAQIRAYNDQLRAACQAYGSKCRYADISTFAFSITMLNGIDFFHPNASGQTALAARTYPGRFTW